MGNPQEPKDILSSQVWCKLACQAWGNLPQSQALDRVVHIRGVVLALLKKGMQAQQGHVSPFVKTYAHHLW